MANPDAAIRPQSWDSYFGQEKLKGRLQISINGALDRMQPLDHVLLSGEPGCGKTSLAALIAMELEQDFNPYVMPLKTKSLQKAILEDEGVLFLDELHRLPKKDQEMLLPVLEDRVVQFENGNQVKIDQPLTVVGATTELERIIKPLRDRFTHRPKFDPYTDEEMAVIVQSMGKRLGMHIPDDDATALGRASAGVPRQARTLVFTARDLDTTEPSLVLEVCGITPDGLTEDHLEYLVALDSLGQQAGVEIISNYTGQPKDILLDLEKLLVRKRLIEYSPKGRILTMKGYDMLHA